MRRSAMADQTHERRICELTADEQEWLQQHRELLAAIVQQEKLALPPEATVLDACDAVVRWWHAQAEDARPDAGMIVNAVGIGLGDALAEVFEMDWRVAEEETGASLVVWRGQPEMVIAPIDSVARRFADGRGGFVAGHYDELAAELDAMWDSADEQEGRS